MSQSDEPDAAENGAGKCDFPSAFRAPIAAKTPAHFSGVDQCGERRHSPERSNFLTYDVRSYQTDQRRIGHPEGRRIINTPGAGRARHTYCRDVPILDGHNCRSYFFQHQRDPQKKLLFPQKEQILFSHRNLRKSTFPLPLFLIVQKRRS